jgi:hypothetical protein
VSATVLPPRFGGQRVSERTVVSTGVADPTAGSPSLTPVLLVGSMLLAAGVAALATTGHGAARSPVSRRTSVLVTATARGNPTGYMKKLAPWSSLGDTGTVHTSPGHSGRGGTP